MQHGRHTVSWTNHIPWEICPTGYMYALYRDKRALYRDKRQYAVHLQKRSIYCRLSRDNRCRAFLLILNSTAIQGVKRKNRNYTRNNRKKKGLSRGQIGIQSLVTVLFSAIDGSAQLNDGHFHIFLRPVCVHKYKYNPRLWSCWQQWFAQHNPHLIGLRGTTSHGTRNWTSIEATCD